MTQIKLRRDTSANFTSVNPVLGIGEPAYETDTKKLKIGDGTTAYTQLEYFSAGGGGGTTDISATLPLKIVDGVISLEVDGQTIQIVDGKLHANLDELGNEVNTLAGDVAGVQADLLKKENKITTTGALSLQEKIQTNAVGFTITSESAMTNDHYQRVPFPESQSSRLYIQDSSFTYPYKSYLAIPYSLGQVIRVPRAYGQLFFGSFDDNGDFIVSIGFNTFYYTTNGFALFGGPIYRAVAGTSEYPPVMPKLNPTQMGYDGNYTYKTPPREAADSGDLYSLSNYLPENDFSCAFYQISPDTTGAIMIQAFWSITTGRCSTAVYRDTETSYQYAGHLDAMRNNIQYALWLPNETGTSYNPSKFGLYDWNVSRIPWANENGWKAFFEGRGANLYSLTGQSSKNYLELNLGDGLSVVDGKLTANSTAPTNMVTTDTAQTITGIKTFNNETLILNGWVNDSNGNSQLKIGGSSSNEMYLGNSKGATNIQGDITLWSTQQVKYKNTGDIFIHTGNLGEYVDGTTITYSGNKLSATGGSSAPTNMVTTDTAQNISGQKEFNKTILFLSNNDLLRAQQSTSYRNGAGLSMGANSTSTDGGVFAPQWKIYNTTGGVDRTETIITTYNQSKLNSSNFNTANKLVKLDSDGKLPAIDGSQLTNLPGGGSAPTNMVTTDTAQTITGLKTFGGTDLSKILLEGSKSLIGFRQNADSLPTTLIGGFFDSNGKKSITIGSTDHEALSLNAKSVQDGSGNKFLTSGNVTAYVTEEFVDGTEGYRVWSNGRCEQWGTITSSSFTEGTYKYIVTLLKPYKDASYQVYATAIVVGGGEGTIGVVSTGRTTTQITFGCVTQYTNGMLWKAEGYIA